MPKDVDAGKVAKGQLSEWYLRIDGGLTYGPIPLQTLSDWAAQGRVAAGNEVSNDKETWISAEKVPDLKMDWIVELKNGDQYGPFSLLAAPYLINRGVIDVDAMLHNLNTGKTLSAQALLKSKGQENVPGAQIAGTSSEESVKLETKAMHMSQSKSNEGGQVARPLAARETGNTPLRMGEADRESLVRSSSPQKMSKAPAAEDSQREGTALDHGAKDEELAQLIAGLSADLEKKNLKIAEQDKQILELKEDYQSLKDRSRRNERQLADKLEEINRIAGDEQAANEQLRKLLEDEKAKRSNVVTQKEHDISEQVVALKKALADAQNTAAAKEQDFLARISKVEKELEAAKKDLALKEQASSAAATERDEKLVGRVKELEQKVKTGEEAAVELKKQLQAEKEAHEATKSNLSEKGKLAEGRLTEVQKELTSAQKQTEVVRKELEAAKKDLALKEQAASAAATERDEKLVGRVKELEQKAKTGEEAAVGLKKQLQAEKEAHEATKSNLSEKLQDAGKRLVKAQAELADTQSSAQSLDRQLAAEKDVISAKNNELIAVKQKATDSERELLKQIAALELKTLHGSQSAVELKNKLEGEKAEHIRTKQEITSRESALLKKATELEQELANAHTITDAQAKELAELKKLLDAGDEKIAAVKRLIDTKEQELDAANKLLAKQVSDLESVRVSLTSQERSAKEASVREKKLSTRIRNLEKKVNTSQEAGKALKEQFKAEAKSHEATRKELEAAKKDLALKEQAESAAATERDNKLAVRIKELEQKVRVGEETVAGLKKQLQAEKEAHEATKLNLSKKLQAELTAEKQAGQEKTLDIKKLSKKIEGLEKELKSATDELSRERVSGAAREVSSAVSGEQNGENISALKDELISAKKSVAESQKKLDNQNQQYAELQRTAKTEIDALKKQVESARGGGVEASGKAGAKQTKRQIEEQQRQLKAELEKALVGLSQNADLGQRMAKELDQIRKELAKEKQSCAELARKETEARTKLEAMKQKDKQSSEWYLKIDDGSIHGPVSFVDLQDWASECRVDPEHEVSGDKKNWIKAKDVRELRMEWMVQLIDGSMFGPINMFAVHHLIEDGVVAGNAEIHNQKSGEKWLAEKLLTPEVMEMRQEIKRLVGDLAQKDKLLAEYKEQKDIVPIQGLVPPKSVGIQLKKTTG